MKKSIFIVPIIFLGIVSCNNGSISPLKEQKEGQHAEIYSSSQFEIYGKIKELNAYLDSLASNFNPSNTKEDIVFFMAIEDIQGFLTKKHSDGVLALKALKFLDYYSKKRNYKPIPKEKIEELRQIIIFLMQKKIYT